MSPGDASVPLTALDALETILHRETALLEAGRLAEAMALAAEKMTAADALRRALADAAPATAAITPAETLAARQEAFRRLLAANLAVIATARSVAEGLLREVSAALAPGLPRTYAPLGRSAASTQGSAPITLSRTT